MGVVWYCVAVAAEVTGGSVVGGVYSVVVQCDVAVVALWCGVV